MADDIIVRVRAEGTGDFVKKLKASGAQLDEVGDKAEKTEKKISISTEKNTKSVDKLVGSYAKLGASIGAAFVTGALVKYLKVLKEVADGTDEISKKNTELKGVYKSINRELAQELIPAYSRLLDLVTKNTEAFTNWIRVQKNAETRSKALGAVIDFFSKGVLLLRDRLKVLSDGFTAIANLIGSIARLFGLGKNNAESFGSTLEVVGKIANGFEKGIQAISKAVISVINGFTTAINKINDWGQAIKGFLGIGNRQIEFETKSKKTIEELTEAQKGLIDAYNKATGELLKYNEGSLLIAEAWKEQLKVSVPLAGSINAITAAIKDQQEIVRKSDPLSKQFADAGAEIERLKKELNLVNALLRGIKEISEDLDAVFEDFIPDEEFLPGDSLFNNEVVIEKAKRLFEIVGQLREGSVKNLKDSIKTEEGIRDERVDKALAGIEAIDAAQSGAFDLFAQANQEQLRLVQERYDQGLISEKEFQKERAAILNRQAKADRAALIIDTAVNVAAGIAAQFKAGAKGIALATIVAALGAAQIAFIASQPIPQFAKGTKGKRKAPQGFALVGEEGPELVQMRGGEKVITAGDSEQLMQLLGSYSIPVQFKSTADELYKPMRTIEDITSNTAFDSIDWNPLLNASDVQRRSLGKKLDTVNLNLVKMNNGLTRRMTKN